MRNSCVGAVEYMGINGTWGRLWDIPRDIVCPHTGDCPSTEGQDMVKGQDCRYFTRRNTATEELRNVISRHAFISIQSAGRTTMRLVSVSVVGPGSVSVSSL